MTKIPPISHKAKTVRDIYDIYKEPSPPDISQKNVPPIASLVKSPVLSSPKALDAPAESFNKDFFDIDLSRLKTPNPQTLSAQSFVQLFTKSIIPITHTPDEIILNEIDFFSEQEDYFQGFDPTLPLQKNDPISEMETNPLFIESNLLRKNIEYYEEHLEKLRAAEQEKKIEQADIEEYNQKLYEQILARKKYNNEKKRLLSRCKKSLLRLIFSDDPENKIFPIILPFMQAALYFYQLQMKSLYKVNPVTPIAAIRWGGTRPIYKALETHKPFFKIRRHSNHIYLARYRRWVDQNVLREFPPRERSPPFLNKRAQPSPICEHLI